MISCVLDGIAPTLCLPRVSTGPRFPVGTASGEPGISLWALPCRPRYNAHSRGNSATRRDTPAPPLRVDCEPGVPRWLVPVFPHPRSVQYGAEVGCLRAAEPQKHEAGRPRSYSTARRWGTPAQPSLKSTKQGAPLLQYGAEVGYSRAAEPQKHEAGHPRSYSTTRGWGTPAHCMQETKDWPTLRTVRRGGGVSPRVIVREPPSPAPG